jgi:tetratricopeptide (TPR) repeat protein
MQRKSQLAIQYAHQVRDTTPLTYVFWIHAGSKARFEEAYKNLAERLGLPGLDNPKTDVLRLVSNWLCDEANGQWIMILDNADDIEVFYPKQGRFKVGQLSNSTTSPIDYLPQSRNGSILITSRSKDAAARLAGGYQQIKEVDRLSEAQALQLLQNKLQDTLGSGDPSDLLRALDHLPLAITQAAAYINRHAPQVTINSYLDEFRKSDQNKENLLTQDTGDIRRDRSASNAVVTTWQMTFKSIQKERRSAAKLLWLMSFFNPQGIPEFVLQSYIRSLRAKVRDLKSVFTALHYGKDESEDRAQKELHADLSILKGYSLIYPTAQRGTWKMHPLVQLCARAWLASSKDLNEWRLKFLALMRRELDPENLERWEDYKELLPHIEGFYHSDPTGKSLEKWLHLLEEVGKLLVNKGKYDEAGTLYQRQLERREKELGVRHLDTLTSVNSLGNVLFSQGKYKEAEKLHQRALEGREKELGVRHLDTLKSVNNLALVLRGQGRYKEADKLHQRALEEFEKELGVCHLDTLKSVNNLALVLGYQGKYKEAEKLHRRALEGREKELGAHHIDTLKCVNNLGNVLYRQGKYKEAEKLHQRALEGREKELGVRHQDTLKRVNKLAVVLRHQGRYEEAEKLHQRALEGRKKELGECHPDTLQSVNNLATVLCDQRKYEEAEKLHQRALEGKEKELGVRHPDTLISVHNLADLLRRMQRYNEATDLYQRAYYGLTQALGPQHPWTVKCCNNFLAMQQEARPVLTGTSDTLNT